ncbi:MAG: nitroreductase family protein [Candidatus Helarchaeota archaeon]
MKFQTLKEIISERRSIRKFKKDRIDEKILIEIIRLATWAPSAGNLQSWDVVLISSQKMKEKLAAAAYHQNFIREASHVVIVCANLLRTARIYGERGATLYAYQDTAAFIENLLLLIHSNGWGAVWIGAFDEMEISKCINTIEEEGIRPVAIIPIGIPNETPRAPKRLPLSSILHLEKYNNFFKSKL